MLEHIHSLRLESGSPPALPVMGYPIRFSLKPCGEAPALLLLMDCCSCIAALLLQAADCHLLLFLVAGLP